MIININDNQFKVKIARTEKEKTEGMMGKKFNQNFNGLFFLMGDGEHCFWMKNCITNLDIIFIEKGKITKIHHNCSPCNKNDDECERYCGNGKFVLELKGGTCKSLNIKKGDSCSLIDKKIKNGI